MIVCMIFFALNAIASPSGDLLDAISMVESSGGKNPKAFTKKTACWGEYQIKNCVIKDVNRFYGTRYTHSDAFDPIKSRDICFKYLDWWGDYFEKKTGIKPTSRTYTRIWNQGYTGMNRKSAIRYWEKVKRHL